MSKRREKSLGNESPIHMPLENTSSTELANIKSIKEVVHNFEEARNSTISNVEDRAQVENSLKLVRDLITIIVSDEGNLDKLEHIIETRASRVSRTDNALSILSVKDSNRLSGRSLNSLTNSQAQLLAENRQLLSDAENKENIQEEQKTATNDELIKEILAEDIVSNVVYPHVEITEAGTQTSNYELYEELAKRVAQIKKGEMSTSDLIAKVMPIRESLKAISAILSGLIENSDNLENTENTELSQEDQPKETTDVQPIEGPTKDTTEATTETTTEDDINNLAYYVFYDISEDKRLKAWQKTLNAREKIAEHIIARTGKRPAEILFNRMSTMELREKQMIQRLMDYADRMSATQSSSRPTSRLRGYVNERNMEVRELQETVPRPRKRDIEISGVPNMVQQEMMGGCQNCQHCLEIRAQWMNSDVLARRIREKKHDLKRVVDYYPDLSHLSVAGQKKPIQCLTLKEMEKKSREIAKKAGANHLYSCSYPAYGAGTSARVGSVCDPNDETE